MNKCSCLVCNHESFTELLNNQVAHPLWWIDGYPDTTQLRYLMCDNCGYIFLWPRFTLKEYNNIYSKTPGLDRKTIQKTRQIMLSSRKDFIKKYAIEHDKNVILEVGPAYGDLLNLFENYKKRIGIEPSKTYINIVQKEGSSIEYYPYILEELLNNEPQLESQSDLVVACHVLEHALNPVKFVECLTKLLRPSGELFIEVPSIEGMSEISTPLYQNLYFGHVSQFSIPVLVRIAVDCGLIPIKVIYKTDYKYPVIQALFRLALPPNEIKKAFTKHASSVTSLLQLAHNSFLKILNNTEINKILIWGCSQDLLDILSKLDTKSLNLYQQKVHLADRNPGKQGRYFRKIMITSPDDCVDTQYDIIIISSRSQILSINIEKDCAGLFPSVTLAHLYQTSEIH